MSVFLRSDPWHTHLQLSNADAPYRQWLQDERSLTARICARCTNFSIHVLHQGLRSSHLDESCLLGVAGHEWVWTRDVLLCADGLPLVFAHSVLKYQHARGYWQMFARLGTRSLGSSLFSDPRIQRGQLYYRHLDSRHALYCLAVHALQKVESTGLSGNDLPTRLWARRSLFGRKSQALLVSEVFLPRVLSL